MDDVEYESVTVRYRDNGSSNRDEQESGASSDMEPVRQRPDPNISFDQRPVGNVGQTKIDDGKTRKVPPLKVRLTQGGLFKRPLPPKPKGKPLKYIKPCINLKRYDISELIMRTDDADVQMVQQTSKETTEEIQCVPLVPKADAKRLEKSVEKELNAIRQESDFVSRLNTVINEGCRNYLRITVHQLRLALRRIYPFIRRNMYANVSQQGVVDLSEDDEEGVEQRKAIHLAIPSEFYITICKL